MSKQEKLNQKFQQFVGQSIGDPYLIYNQQEAERANLISIYDMANKHDVRLCFHKAGQPSQTKLAPSGSVCVQLVPDKARAYRWKIASIRL